MGVLSPRSWFINLVVSLVAVVCPWLGERKDGSYISMDKTIK